MGVRLVLDPRSRQAKFKARGPPAVFDLFTEILALSGQSIAKPRPVSQEIDSQNQMLRIEARIRQQLDFDRITEHRAG